MKVTKTASVHFQPFDWIISVETAEEAKILTTFFSYTIALPALCKERGSLNSDESLFLHNWMKQVSGVIQGE